MQTPFKLVSHAMAYPVELTGTGLFAVTVGGEQIMAESIAGLQAKLDTIPKCRLAIGYTRLAYGQTVTVQAGTITGISANWPDVLLTEENGRPGPALEKDGTAVMPVLDRDAAAELHDRVARFNQATAELTGWVDGHTTDVWAAAASAAAEGDDDHADAGE